jgi:hypothetical protein
MNLIEPHNRQEFQNVMANLIRVEGQSPFDERTYTVRNIKAAWKEIMKKVSKTFRFMAFYLAFAPVAQPDRATDF